jgi:release factor glutamine methyltransferase
MRIQEVLGKAEIDRLDAEILLSFVLHRDRGWLLGHSQELLTQDQKKLFESHVTRRKKHEPIAYILGEKAFYGRKFFVDRRVLIPRPSTEILIDEVKRIYQYTSTPVNSPRTKITPADSEIVILAHFKEHYSLPTTHYPLIVDVGTGSGCIGITLALEIPEAKILCTDISEDALDVAKKNVKRFEVHDRITFQRFPYLPYVPDLPYLLVSNPPYIPSGTPLPPNVLNFEPHEALFAGPEGMDVLSPLVKQALHDGHCLGFILECREEQAKKISSYF